MSQGIITMLGRILAQLGGGSGGTGLAPVSVDKTTRVFVFSTTTPLGSGVVYTSLTIDMINYVRLQYFMLADQGGTYFIQISDDGVTWYNTTAAASTQAANAVTSTLTSTSMRYARFVYTNGATLQGSFKLSAYLIPS